MQVFNELHREQLKDHGSLYLTAVLHCAMGLSGKNKFLEIELCLGWVQKFVVNF